MAHTTEAACLLQSGALYTRRLGLRSGGATIFAGRKRGAFSLYFDDEPIYHFDLDGRWQRAFCEGVHFLKSLDGSVDAIDRPREGQSLVLRRRVLGFAETADLDAAIRSGALDVMIGIGHGRFEIVSPPEDVLPLTTDELREMLDRIGRWDSAAWFAQREAYLGTYGRLPFVPPDSQSPVILQATLGHADGIAFGGAPPAEHYVRSAEEFEEHAETVARLMGRRLFQCRCVFLAGSDVLCRPVDEVAAFLEVTSRIFPIEPKSGRLRQRDLPEDRPSLDGIDAFLDRFDAVMLGPSDFESLRSLGLRRVTIGVESGDIELRAIYGKRWSDGDLRGVVNHLKGAALNVSVLVLVGAGGQAWVERHEAMTAGLLESLALGSGDFVYLIDADELGGATAHEALTDHGLTPLMGREVGEARSRLKARLHPLRRELGIKVLTYSLEKQ